MRVSCLSWAFVVSLFALSVGAMDFPADCALARKEHPRLLFTRADLPRLRERLKLPRIAKELAWARQLASRSEEHTSELQSLS